MSRIAQRIARTFGLSHPFFRRHPESRDDGSFEFRLGPFKVEEFHGLSLSVDTRSFRLHQYPLRCAMHGATNLWIRGVGYVCFKPPTRVFGRWWPWYLYVSDNATPWGARWALDRATRREIAEQAPAPGATEGRGDA